MTTEPEDVPDSDDLATKSLRRLRKSEIAHEQMKARLKYFPLFGDTEYEDYKGEVKKVPKAKSRAKDSPALQMMLARRDRYESCCRQIARIEKLIDQTDDPKEQSALMYQLVSLEATADRHAKGIESVLASITKSDAAVQQQRARLLTTAAQLAQQDRHHADRLDLQRKTNPADLPDAELMRIANGETEAEGSPDA